MVLPDGFDSRLSTALDTYFECMLTAWRTRRHFSSISSLNSLKIFPIRVHKFLARLCLVQVA